MFTNRVIAWLMGIILIPALSAAGQHLAGDSTNAVVIAHPGVEVDTLSVGDLKDMYLLETNKWSDGGLVILFDLKPDTPAKKQFYGVIGKEPRQLKKHWMRVILAGEGLAPKVLRAESDMVYKVANTPGAIGYVDISEVTEAVKVIMYCRPLDKLEVD